MRHGIEEKPKKKRVFLKIIITLIILAGLAAGGLFALKVAPNYRNTDITDRNNLVLNFSNVTGRMKHNLIIDENGVVYLSYEDIKNYYDKHIYYDKQYKQIVTSTEDKLAVFKVDENKMIVNGSEQYIKGKAFENNQVYYLPISDMEDVYNIKITKADNKVIIESLDRKLTTAIAKKKITIRSKATFFSRGIEKVNSGEKIAIALALGLGINRQWQMVNWTLSYWMNLQYTWIHPESMS